MTARRRRQELGRGEFRGKLDKLYRWVTGSRPPPEQAWRDLSTDLLETLLEATGERLAGRAEVRLVEG